jgi:hypothetical protein
VNTFQPWSLRMTFTDYHRKMIEVKYVSTCWWTSDDSGAIRCDVIARFAFVMVEHCEELILVAVSRPDVIAIMWSLWRLLSCGYEGTLAGSAIAGNRLCAGRGFAACQRPIYACGIGLPNDTPSQSG